MCKKTNLEIWLGVLVFWYLRIDIGEPLEEEFGILVPITWSPEQIDFDKNCKKMSRNPKCAHCASGVHLGSKCEFKDWPLNSILHIRWCFWVKIPNFLLNNLIPIFGLSRFIYSLMLCVKKSKSVSSYEVKKSEFWLKNTTQYAKLDFKASLWIPILTSGEPLRHNGHILGFTTFFAIFVKIDWLWRPRYWT